MIPVYKPYLPKESVKYAHDAIESTWISSHGKYLSEIKDEIKKITNSKYVILTNNGTSATHLLAIALKFKYPNIKNLIVPSNVYVAAWNMFLLNPKYNLIPVDSDINSWNIDESKLNDLYREYQENTAFLGVHNISSVINIPSLKKKYPKWVFVEDNCEGFMGKYPNGQRSGTESIAFSVSFFGNKTITSGEGGMFCTNDKEIFEYINRAKSHFMTKEKFIFDGLGYNYRMTNIQAAILYGQLEILNIILEKKKDIFEIYQNELSSEKRISFQISENLSYWMFGIRINNSSKEEVDSLKLFLYQNDIDTRPMFPTINMHGHLREYKGPFPNSDLLYETALILPSYPGLSKGELLYICNTIKEFFK